LLIVVPTLQALPKKLREWLGPLRQWALQAMHISNLVRMIIYFSDRPFDGFLRSYDNPAFAATFH
jgi:hypothetical protein